MPIHSETLELNHPTPLTVLSDSAGVRHDLHDLLGANATVILFLRGFWCGICTTQLQQLQQQHARLQHSGINAVVIMTDKAETVAGSLYAAPLPFPILIDADRAATRAWGVLDPATTAPQSQSNVTRPATFVLDREGVIRYFHIGSGMLDRPSIAMVTQTAEQVAKADMFLALAE